MTSSQGVGGGEPSGREALAAELRRLKEKSGLSFGRLAGKTHYSRSSWERFLNGKQLPTAVALEEFAAVMEADAEFLLGLLEGVLESADSTGAKAGAGSQVGVGAGSPVGGGAAGGPAAGAGSGAVAEVRAAGGSGATVGAEVTAGRGMTVGSGATAGAGVTAGAGAGTAGEVSSQGGPSTTAPQATTAQPAATQAAEAAQHASVQTAFVQPVAVQHLAVQPGTDQPVAAPPVPEQLVPVPPVLVTPVPIPPVAVGRAAMRDWKPGARMTGLVAAGALLGSLATVFALGAGPFGDGSSPGTAAPSPQTPSPGCSKDTCLRRDPQAMDCQWDATTARETWLRGMHIELRYSAACGAVWGRVESGAVGDTVTIKDKYGEELSATIRVDRDTYTGLLAVDSDAPPRTVTICGRIPKYHAIECSPEGSVQP
ncbi:helix-turn-helix domain-containing protein [Streptomyces sp. NPDC005281]|uniref:helix-turn-helix domain-containing protein n=1 Tax=Streptomyces sp. NPDC005281 TaxID=3155712 RepID=UPI0033B036A7